MRKLALTLTVALVVGGCSSESEVAQLGANSKHATSLAPSAHHQVNRTTAFAAMPDNGTLLAYQRSQQSMHRGAQTYHAVKLSEAHALNAAAPGKSIELPMPSGGTMHIDYVRHEESLDGNWSWIGKTTDGSDAVITFGESAVFGRISQRNTEALRLTTSAGRSWLVESDPSKMLDGNLGRDSDESDTLIPRNVVASISAKKRSTAGAVAANDEAASAANTIDVALGFTNGLVTKYGNAANVNTRLANLVAIANQGYQNSLINPRIRLVRTVQVGYTDSNTNELALEAVTGFTCTTSGCTAQAIPTELVPLRTARDTYGADLVSLVRPFQAPQHQGCGIAWLLGGGGFAIDNTDAPFAYSVVSDGSDVDESDGRTYFCREETLAHELGHNMGQQHNIEDAGSPPDTGMHSYSYGYREATTTGFYTVMAYRLANSNHFSINHFGNPSVNYADTGRPTGSATTDNARSMNISMPLVTQFRTTVVPLGGKARNDINADGFSDLLWFNGNNVSYWQMTASGAVTSTGGQAVPNTYIPISTGDYDGNGTSDILYRQGGILRVGLKAPTGAFSDTPVSTFPAGWRLVGSGDINGDGRADLVWQNGTTVSVWLMNGAVPSSYTSASLLLPNVGTTPVMMADFSCDGVSDILWRNSNGELLTWVTRPATTGGVTNFIAQTIGTFPNGWASRGAGDFNGDGCQDITWFNGAVLSYWQVSGSANGVLTVGSTGGRALPTGSSMLSILDIGGDGYADVLTRRPNGELAALIDFGRSTIDQGLSTFPVGWLPIDGQMPYTWRRNSNGDYNIDGRTDLGWTNGSVFSFWNMNGAAVTSYGGQSFASARTTLGSGDFDGDFRRDVLFQTTSGQLVRWRNTGGQFVEEAIGSYPTGWTLAGIGDVDGDGKDDIIWQNGAVYSFWLMEGNTVRLAGGQNLPTTGYQPLSSNDLDGDGRIDILWRTGGNALYVSKSLGGGFSEVPIAQYPTGWSFLGAGDVDGDLANDLMWHNGAGVFTHWKLNNLTVSPQYSQSMPLTGTVVATGDYDANGITDLIWQTTGGAVVLAIPDGSQTQASKIFPISNYPTGWTAVR